MTRGAEISPCGRYRYSLTRYWDGPTWRGGRGLVCWLMLNPSTADASVDDPTIRKCIGFSKALDYSGLIVVNLFAYRSTNPRALPLVADPVGPDNDAAIHLALMSSRIAIAAWGTQRWEGVAARGRAIRRKILELYHLGLTKDGSPKHPLYLPMTTPLERWWQE